MLSGIGPAAHLRANGIERIEADLRGVGQNLQDRYEVSVVAELPDKQDFPILEGHKFEPPKDNTPPSELKNDTGITEWMNHHGLYATNGVVLSVIRASRTAEKDKEGNIVPDLFIFGVPGVFQGYQKGYAYMTHHDGPGKDNHKSFTWVILKARTRNRGGTVELDGTFARRRPKISFNYFEDGGYEKKEGEKPWEKDLDALVEGIEWAVFVLEQGGLKVKDPLGTIFKEKDLDKRRELIRQHVHNVSWGHHACGTCKIGRVDDASAVLDGNFRVRGIEGLRVVDASVFPRIPGFFIVTSIYMISEKAAKVILEERKDRQK
jgi:choline dehydrogenase